MYKQETCGMVDKESMTGTGTVYVNGSSVGAFFRAHSLSQVDILKIDAGTLVFLITSPTCEGECEIYNITSPKQSSVFQPEQTK